MISRSLAKLGYGVIVHYNSASSQTESEATVKEIVDAGGQAWPIQTDLIQVDKIAELFAFAKTKGESS